MVTLGLQPKHETAEPSNFGASLEDIRRRQFAYLSSEVRCFAWVRHIPRSKSDITEMFSHLLAVVGLLGIAAHADNPFVQTIFTALSSILMLLNSRMQRLIVPLQDYRIFVHRVTSFSKKATVSNGAAREGEDAPCC